jgi:hypothetical protein
VGRTAGAARHIPDLRRADLLRGDGGDATAHALERRGTLIASGRSPAVGAAAIAAPEVFCLRGGLSENLGASTLTGYITVVFVRAELEKKAQFGGG